MDTVPAVVTDTGQAVLLAFTRALSDFMAFLPKLVGALLVLLIGWLISSLVEKLVARGLRMLRFNQIADRAEID